MIKAAWEHSRLMGSGVAAVIYSIFTVGYMLLCAYRGTCAMAKRIGWASVAVLLGFAAWATYTGTPTQEEKEDALEQEQGEAQTNAMFGAMLLGFGSQFGGAGNGATDSQEQGGEEDQVQSSGLMNAAAPSLPVFPDPVVEDEAAPAIRSLTIFDHAAGFALSRIGTGETFDFSAPEGAMVCDDWLAFGASRDWFKTGNGEWGTGNGERGFAFPFGTNEVDALTVFSNGSARPRMKRRDTFISPFETTLCVVPSANWPQLDEDARPSVFWHCHTPSNTLVMTWRNVLIDQRVEKPVSFQAECFENGDVVFRYDLSRLDDTTVTNVVVGIRNAWYGRVFTRLDRNVTSLHWTRLDPRFAIDSDPDGDGLSTDDEVLVYHTDPYSADTDMDMLTDDEEINLRHTDPTDPNSVSDLICDGMATVIGDLDPFSCPEGSTNTVWEHAFYTGTSNAPFAYPVDTESSAVLTVTVRGVGSGRLVVGDKVIPLMARPQLLLGASGGESYDPTATTLHIPVPKGVRHVIWGSVPETLQLEIDSGAFAIGRLPRWYTLNRGWIAFPNTTASAPCIHDLGSRRVSVSLDPGPEISGLTCNWNGSSSIEAENLPPLSAELTGLFPRSSTTPVTYTLSHPDRLFGENTYTQTARFCPRLSEEEDEELNEYEQGDYAYAEDEHWCCFWGMCCDGQNECSCGCDRCSGGGDVPADMDEECPVHHVSYEQCEALHDAAYDAARQLDGYPGLLKIRDPLIYERVDLPCPEGECHCCPCPDHHSNHVSLAYCSYRIRVVDDSWAGFSVSDHPCSVHVAGVRPSMSVGDAHLAFATNGVIFRTCDETVLGMEIVKPIGPGLDTYNSLSRTLGFPMTVNTNLDRSAQLTLKTNVRLPFGNVKISLEDTEGQFAVWRYDYRAGEYRKLLDSDGRSSIDLPIDRWRLLVGSASVSSSPETPIYITSSRKGSTTLRFGYWGVSDGRIIEDWDSQIITSVNPPLFADMNRDGRIDTTDVYACIQGREFVYWTNEDTVKGGYLDESSDISPNAGDHIVNGIYDLVNLFPLAIDLKGFAEVWGDAVSYTFEPEWNESNAFGVCYAAIPWSDAGSVQTNECLTVDRVHLYSSPLEEVSGAGVSLSANSILRFSDSSGVMLAEARVPYMRLRVVIRFGEEVLYSYTVPLCIRSVRSLYRFFSLRGAELNGDNTFVPPTTPRAFVHPDEKDQDIFFTHGFNVSEEDARKWGDAIFKRFWLSGSNARFNMVTWTGNYHWTGDWANGLWYPHDVWFALRSAGALKRLVEREQPDSSKRVLMTQSLGNVVACEALRQGLHVGKYFMFDAAVATEAIDASLQNASDEIRAKYVKSAWLDYDPLSWSANWFRWFTDDQDDARGKIGWPGRFSDALGNADVVYNYYSTGDEVFHETDNPPWLLEGMDESSANYCWQKQETLKGSRLPGGTMYGGWMLYTYNLPVWSDEDNRWNTVLTNYTPAQASAMVSNGSITNNPVFNRGFDPMFDRNASQDDQWLALAKYVPAVSHPVGGNPVWNAEGKAIDMNLDSDRGGVSRPNGWGRQPVKNQTPWLHSDMKDIAFFYVFKLYEQLIQKGNLK